MEYELMLYEQSTFMESYCEGLMEADNDQPSQPGVSYDNRGTVRKTAGALNDARHAIGRKLFGSDEHLTRGQAFMRRMKEFFTVIKQKMKQIIQAFMQKVDELFKLNDKFIRERLTMIKGINDDKFWSTVNIDIWDYDEASLKKNAHGLFGVPRLDAKSYALSQLLNFKGTNEQFDQEFFGKIMDHCGSEDSFKEGCKNFFRKAKSSTDKMKHYNGGAAKEHCLHMAEFLQNYKESYAKPIRDSVSELEGAVGRVERDFMNGKFVEYSEQKESYMPVIEREDQTQPQRAGVHVEGKDANSMTNNRGAAQSGTEEFNRLQHYGQRLLTIDTARMTIAEEYYFAALRILKSIYSAAEQQNRFSADQYNEWRRGENQAQAAGKKGNDTYNHKYENQAQAALNNSGSRRDAKNVNLKR